MFTLRDVYPHYEIFETTERTIPTEQHRKDMFVKEDADYVTPQERRNIWLGIIILVVLLVVFTIIGK